jgi:hypothetical protein
MADETTANADARAMAAEAAGLPPTATRWLSGDTYEELVADARTLAASVEPEPEPYTGGFDGGVRQMIPTPPSFEATLQAEAQMRRQERASLAATYDRVNVDPAGLPVRRR